MRVLLTALALTSALIVGPALAEDDVFGAARQDVLETPNLRTDTKKPAALSINISPWHKAPGTTREEQVARALKNPPPWRRFDPKRTVTHSSILKNMAMTKSIQMEGWDNSSLGVLLLCDYEGKKEFYRELTFTGKPEDFLAKGKKRVWKQIVERAEQICKESPRSAQRRAVRDATTKPPGKGDGMKRLDHFVYSFNTGIGGGGFFQISTRTYALMDDGWAMRNPRVPLPDFDVDASRRVEPDRWNRWRKAEGGGFELLRESKGKESWRKISGIIEELKPAEAGRRYDGRYTYAHTGGSIIAGARVSRAAYTMKKNGTYETSSSQMNETIGAFDNSVISITTANKDGCGSAISMTGDVVGGGGRTNPDCGDGKAGRYEIDGYVITLHANNGTTSRYGFYPIADNAFSINGRTYTKISK